MIQHNHIPTLTVHTDWDEPLVSTLEHLSIFFCEKGYWEKVEEVALEILQMANKTRRASDTPLRQAYNTWLLAKQRYDFDCEDDESCYALEKAESNLAHTLLDYHADPEMYLIVRVVMASTAAS